MIYPYGYYNELFHYGVKRRSGRYPYGSGDRPFQGSNGVDYRRVAKTTSRPGIKKTIANKKEALKKAKEEKEKKAELEARRKHEEDRKRVLREGTATELKEYANELSNADLEAALRRLELNRRLNSYTKQETQSTFDKVDKIMAKVGKVNNWASTSISAYENVQRFQKIYEQLSKQAQQQAQRESKKKVA